MEKEENTMKTRFTITFTWDDEASVWIATSDDIPGLVLEHSSFDVLVERVRLAAPELLGLNCGFTEEVCLDFSISGDERYRDSHLIDGEYEEHMQALQSVKDGNFVLLSELPD